MCDPYRGSLYSTPPLKISSSVPEIFVQIDASDSTSSSVFVVIELTDFASLVLALCAYENTAITSNQLTVNIDS